MATENKNSASGAEGRGSTTTVGTPPQSGSRVDRAQAGNQSQNGDGGQTGGRTTIAEDVVAKVAGIAAREVPGVHALGGGGARALGAIRDAVRATDLTQGVKIEVGETQA